MIKDKRKHKRRKRRSLMERGRRFLRSWRGLQDFIESTLSREIQIFLKFLEFLIINSTYN